MLGVGDKFPEFKLKGVISSSIKDAFTEISADTYKGKWLVVFFWPKDFTFVCPTEIAEFGHLNTEFAKSNAQVLGISTDSEFVHLAWKQQNEEIGSLPFPMLADIKRDLSSELGILDREEGVAQRATYIIGPDGVIRFLMITDLNIGRNPQEVLRILDALQTGGLCACNWKKGEATITVS
ncbi:MAG: Alkyl hydroperoxide reductase C [Legionellaceae bacterium]